VDLPLRVLALLFQDGDPLLVVLRQQADYRLSLSGGAGASRVR
jgi:hypothetical protein